MDWRLNHLLRGLKISASIGESKGDNLIAGLPLDSVNPRKTVLALKYDAPSTKYGVEALLTNTAAKNRVSTATFFKPASSNVIDMFAYWQPLSALQVNVGILNATNKKYWQWSDVRGVSVTSAVLDRFSQPGRNISVSAKLTF